MILHSLGLEIGEYKRVNGCEKQYSHTQTVLPFRIQR